MTRVRTFQSTIGMDHYAHLLGHKQSKREIKKFVDYGQQVKHQTQIKIKIFHNDVVQRSS